MVGQVAMYQRICYISSSSTSSLDVELLAINAALLYCLEIQGNSFCILTDSKTALNTLCSYKPSSYYYRIQDIILILKTLTKINKKVYFQWIPGHCNLHGNEIADKLAKCSANFYPKPILVQPLDTIIKQVKLYFSLNWIQKWKNGVNGQNLRDLLEKPNCLFQYKAFPRHIQSFISRARTGHLVTKSYLFKFNMSESPICARCDKDEETIGHIMFDCHTTKSKENLKNDLRKNNINEDIYLKTVLTTTKYWEIMYYIYKEHCLKLD